MVRRESAGGRGPLRVSGRQGVRGLHAPAPVVRVQFLEQNDRAVERDTAVGKGRDPEMGAQVGHEPRDQLALPRSEEHTSELQSLAYLVCRLLLEKKKALFCHAQEA